MREFAAFIMASRWRAMAVAGVFGVLGIFFVPLILLSAAAVGLVTLRRGGWEGILAIVGGAVIVGGIFPFLPPKPGFPFPLVAALWPPVWIGGLVLRQTFSQGWALSAIGGMMILYVLGMHALTGGQVEGFWEAWLQRSIANVPGATVEGFRRDGTLHLMNGLVAMGYGASIVLSLLLARWWQAILYHPGGFGEEFRQLRLPRWLLVLLVGGMWLAGYWNKVLLSDLLIASMTIYLFQGLAALHGIVAQRNLSGFWLVPAYGLLLLMPQYGVMGLSFMGAVDSLVNFRDRTDSDENA
ncbi:YybS family protein [Methylohalobius crimeensis]|uniref:DUF2232 domain-containing protein n=1 Tax=Methylohalobius crimeensis TaxID=244365 RepID=UPI0003B5216A|nr:DUF2232 domain-containing protein [Methylohalobius crimeensis]